MPVNYILIKTQKGSTTSRIEWRERKGERDWERKTERP